MIASACGASSESGRLRCTRTPRSTWAIAPSPKRVGHVDEQGEVDAVPLDERQLLEHLAAARALTGQRLQHGREVGEQDRDQRPGHELGDPAPLARPSVERAVVEALHEADLVAGEQRAEEPGDEGAPKLRTSASHHTIRSPWAAWSDFHSASPLPVPGPTLGEHVAGGDHPCARRQRRRARVVGGAVVDDDDLVDEGREVTADRARWGRWWRPRRARGRQTEIDRPRLAARSRATENSAWCQVRRMGARGHLGLRRRVASGRERGHAAMFARNCFDGLRLHCFHGAIIQSGRGTGPMTPRQPVVRHEVGASGDQVPMPDR